MRILAISDTHVGCSYEHRQDALADTDAMFAQVLALVEERQIDLCLHAGDVFHRAKPSPAEYLCFRRFCDGLAALGVPMVAVEGNGMHSAAPGQRSASNTFATPTSTRTVRRVPLDAISSITSGTIIGTSSPATGAL